MNTPSHLIMTAVIRRAVPHVPIRTSAFLLGAVAPDLALYGLSVAGMGYYRLVQGWTMDASFRYIFGLWLLVGDHERGRTSTRCRNRSSLALPYMIVLANYAPVASIFEKEDLYGFLRIPGAK